MSKKIYNALFIGPTSSGKTTIAKYFAKKYGGRCISLDGDTASGRPVNFVASFNNPKKFMKEDLGVLIRKQMIKEIKGAVKAGVPWFVDDIDPYILKLLPKQLRNTAKIICIIPSIPVLTKNIIERNKSAMISSEERHIFGSLKQYLRFIVVEKCNGSCTPEEIKKFKSLIVTNRDIMDACEYDKIHYSVNEKKDWENGALEILDRFGFDIKQKKLSYAKLRIVNFGQDFTLVNDHKLDMLINNIEHLITIK